MKRLASLSVLVLALALPAAAQTKAVGSFSFKGTEGLQTVDFDAAGDERSASGGFSLSGPTLVSDVTLDDEDPKATMLVPDFTMKVTVDCMSNALNSRVAMGGKISDSNVRSMIGRFATLTVEDHSLDPKDPTSRFTFGSSWQTDISWFPTDSEVRGDSGWSSSWWATDAEQKDDVGFMISRQRQVDCHSYPVDTFDLDPIADGRISVQ